MMQWHKFKSLGKREFDTRLVLTALASVSSWCLSLSVSVYYTLREPHDQGTIVGRRIWDQNMTHNQGFALDSSCMNAFWIALFAAQLFAVIGIVLRGRKDDSTMAICIHFCVNNLLHAISIILFVRSVFGWTEFILVLNFVNLSCLHFLHQTAPLYVCGPLVSGPLSWGFLAMYWNGSMAVDAGDNARNVLTVLAMFGILGYGLFISMAFKDRVVAVALGFFAAAIAIAQFRLEQDDFRWITPTITSSILVFTSVLSISLNIRKGKVLDWECDERKEDDGSGKHSELV
ncbi:hypothetical protein JDV02_010553 [Purpureocillium takamizusanense]|uniref:DUF1774-domain-containing protein n=1 Tax=Purpureocillium takamizusanense TaxID=2060973 RepID=A0A9Q8QS16_9HYPO|nr:uncharacterized protein JDV02_010553 [Purpureocillium takamizusanense]UNI24835.1 hypothetical protein JDV02_010553 [Purpureocillium takamizusanense]